jgi:hypothetical protein
MQGGCPKRQPHATVNASNFHEEQHHQGRWTKRFSRRQRESQAQGRCLLGAPRMEGGLRASVSHRPSRSIRARPSSVSTSNAAFRPALPCREPGPSRTTSRVGLSPAAASHASSGRASDQAWLVQHLQHPPCLAQIPAGEACIVSKRDRPAHPQRHGCSPQSAARSSAHLAAMPASSVVGAGNRQCQDERDGFSGATHLWNDYILFEHPLTATIAFMCRTDCSGETMARCSKP